jgi:hypothetical protein
LLELLGVKHTKEFSNRYFNEHPHKYNLFGISQMLSDYGIEKHKAWIQSRIRATPTVLVNGYQLPDNYRMEDLRYFTEFNVDVK